MKKVIAIVATVLVVGSVFVYLLLSSFEGDSMVYYKTVDELLADRARLESRPIRINGLLVDGSIQRKPGTDEYRFSLSKNGAQLAVTYRGILPETMLPGRELVVEGALAAGGNDFAATEILTKCPSKYESVAKSKAKSSSRPVPR
jgi:cytochrome c-type biogenesis protein CcmE